MAAIGLFFANLWGRIQLWVFAAIMFLVVLVVAFFKGRSSGKEVVIAQQKQDRADAIVERKETDAKVDALPASDVDTRLDKWMRD